MYRDNVLSRLTAMCERLQTSTHAQFVESQPLQTSKMRQIEEANVSE
jgi:hypothetical protein